MTFAPKKKKTKTSAVHPSILNLVRMLQIKRPAYSQNVQWFIEDYIAPLGGFTDKAGNHIICTSEASPVMFVSHTDTVHTKSGYQDIAISACGDFLQLKDGSKSNCLGADCTTGVWLMLEMIEANIPATYVFCANEEIGGLGSAWLAKNNPDLFRGIDFAISLDRKGTNSVITHQFGGRCCSDLFASDIAKQLPSGFKPDDTGTFTDSANFIGLVGECSNLSVGYYNQHTANETQSISHALAMREALCRFDPSLLTKYREAGSYEPFDYASYGASELWQWDYFEMSDYISENAESVADYLLGLGVTLGELQNAIEKPRYLTKGA